MGVIFDPKKNTSPWIKSYAALPVVDLINNETLRIYFSTRDDYGRSLPTFIDVDPIKPSNIKYIHDKPILNLGPQGTFDDSGIMPSWVINIKEKKYLYYIGWNPQKTVSYRLSIGLAISLDGGKSFKKSSEGPLLDRDYYEPYFNTAPCVLKLKDGYIMWYVSCTGWKNINKWPEPFYNIKSATSKDGIFWQRNLNTCINYDDFTHAIGKPCVYYEDNKFKMLYSYRNSINYRTDKERSYRLGYAESKDGFNWIRMDNKVGINMSNSGWDSIMIEYCSTYKIHNKRFLIYNGNGFGESGFGYAILE